VKIIYVVVVVVVCFFLLHIITTRNRGMCYTTKCDTVEDGLIDHASEGNPGGKEANPTLSCNLGNVRRKG
jgi:hypothetical protein